jgi:hypothetical protein
MRVALDATYGRNPATYPLLVRLLTLVDGGRAPRDAMRHKRSQGERVGNIGFGCRLSHDGQHLEPHPPEQAAVEQIRNLRRQGITLRGIATTLDSRVTARAAAPSGGWNRSLGL